jgi:uncharacterized repeat protein (TIGR01451 family)
MTTTNFRLKSLLITLLFFFVQGFSFAQSYVSEANMNGFFLKKVVSDTTIASGQTFSYTIYFSIPAGATGVTISDVIPAGLHYQSHSVSAVCGTMTTVSTPTVGGGGTLQLAFPSVTSGCSGSISIVVNFPIGTTCNGTAVHNRACLVGKSPAGNADFCTGFVNTTATAVNPWQISKYVIGAAYQGGACPRVTLDSVITYQICVSKMYGTNGQLNLVNGVVTDVLPAGAVLQSSTCGATQTGNTITWNVGNVSVSPPYNNQCCNISVLYPRAIFPLGSQITNNATLTGGLGSVQPSCGQFTQTSNSTCVEIKGYTQGSFGKYAYTTGQPGCGGYYWIQFCNTGTLPISGLTITDNLPAGLTGYTTSNGAGVTSSITGSVMTATYAGTLAPGGCAFVQVNFTIPAGATIGSTINNCATATYTGLSTPIQSCAPFIVAAPAATACIWKEVCGKLPSYTAGQTFRYRLRVQNIGGQAITGASISDVLNSNLTYVGNPTYYTTSTYNGACSSGGTLPSGATALSGVTFSQSGQTLTFGLPTIPASCQSLFYQYCSNYGNFSVPYYYIEFDVKVSDTACIGNIPNYFAITGGNVTAQNSNVEYVNVVGTAAFNLDKTVSKDNGATYAASATTAAGSNVQFKLKFTPSVSSTTAMRHVTYVDLFPRDNAANDNFILNRLSNRGSQYDFLFQNTVSTTPAATMGYDNTNAVNALVNGINIPSVGIMFPYAGGVGTPTWVNAAIPANSKNIRAYFGATAITATGAEAIVKSQVPTTVTTQQLACNTFAANAATCHLINSTLMTNQAMAPLESGTACVTATPSVFSCCDSLKVFPSSTPTSKCCSRITFNGNCEIRKVNVTLTNGTISGAAFAGTSAACFNNPSPAIGTTNYAFTPVSGVCSNLDLQICANATTSGWVYLNYVVEFANGTKCDRRDSVQCQVIPTCCETTQIISYETADRCCSQIKTECPVKQITVNVLNGTLGNVTFAGASASFYTGLTGSTLTSNNFGASSAPSAGMDMTVCPISANNGNPVIINYIIYFTNGQVCEKSDTLKCQPIDPIDCCEATKIVPVTNQKCCSQLISKCYVDKVVINVTGGVIGNVSFAGVSAGCYTGLTGSTLTNTTISASCSTTGGFDMTLCPKATSSTGIVYISYTVIFADGKKCTKTDSLKCEPPVIDCCRETEVISFDTQGKCCSQIKTTCKIKVLQVSVVNGTVGNISFAGVDAACYTPIVNSTATNILISPTCAGGSLLDMMICPKPTATPTIIKYTIAFANGTECVKYDTLYCKPDTACTIAACFAHNATGLSVNFNATGTTSNYPIVMYVWSYGDGTYGTSTTPTISHNYTTSGEYEVCMTVQVLYNGTICDCSKKICKKIKIAQGATSSSGCTSSLTSTGATGEVGQLKASPNPSSHDFHITLDKMESVLDNGKAEIRLYNVQGKLILTKTIDVLTKEFDIQAESYPAGLYMLTLQKDGEVISSIKVVKN